VVSAAYEQVNSLRSISYWHKFSSPGFISEKDLPTGEIGVRGFSKPGGDFLLLMKTVGRFYPTGLVLKVF
jgi:hypothetical protein